VVGTSNLRGGIFDEGLHSLDASFGVFSRSRYFSRSERRDELHAWTVRRRRIRLHDRDQQRIFLVLPLAFENLNIERAKPYFDERASGLGPSCDRLYPVRRVFVQPNAGQKGPML
jgi:hypothetical protein